MKIAIPIDNKKGMSSLLAEHFGRCPNYILLDGSGSIIEIIENTSRHMGGQGFPPELIKKHGAEILLCKGIGPRAIDLFKQFDIDVYVFHVKTVQEAFDSWKSKKTRKADIEDACEEHKK
jgi:predicted Fe-Mo cluster-binding NifX family protein